MNDEVSQQPPTTNVGENASVQAEPVSQEQKPQEFLTRDEATKMEERVTRLAQSLVDKADHRITERVQGGLKTLEDSLKVQRSAGIEITPEQEARARQKVVEQAMIEPPSQTSAAQATPNEQPAQQLDPVVARALGMMNKIGAVIEQNDPEFAQVKKALDTGDPDEFLLASAEAAKAKKARLASQTERSAARVPSGSGEPATPKLSPRELLQKGLAGT